MAVFINKTQKRNAEMRRRKEATKEGTNKQREKRACKEGGKDIKKEVHAFLCRDTHHSDLGLVGGREGRDGVALAGIHFHVKEDGSVSVVCGRGRGNVSHLSPGTEVDPL